MSIEVERVALQAVAEASRLIRQAWCAAKSVRHKGTVDLVTETDREVEGCIVARLRSAFPDHMIVAEEASSDGPLQPPPADRRAWYVDPLDGTTNFAHGYPVCAVSLAMGRGNELLFGVVHDPLRDETFVAHRDSGATLNGNPIRVSATRDIDGALLATGFPYDRRRRAEFYLGFFKDFMERAQGIRRAGAAAIDLCWLACGRLDGFWEWKLKPWDTAAGALIVREAGGLVSDFRGGAFDPYGEQTLASNGLIHQAMIEVLAGRLPK